MDVGTPIDLEKMRSIGVIGKRSGDTVTQVYDGIGRPIGKDVTDELGNTVHVRDERQDVTIQASTVNVKVVQ